jgi:hypothetical protein
LANFGTGMRARETFDSLHSNAYNLSKFVNGSQAENSQEAKQFDDFQENALHDSR